MEQDDKKITLYDTIPVDMSIVEKFVEYSKQNMPLYENVSKWTEENQGIVYTGRYQIKKSKYKLINWYRKITNTEKQEEIIHYIWKV